MSQKITGVKGMNDLLPDDVEVWQHVERTARELFSRFGYGEVRTPMVEDTALFVRSVGETTDIVGKEMYTFEDKGGRSLSLRPEGTAPAARAYIEHSIGNQKLPAIGYALHVAGVSRTVKHGVLAQRDLLRDRSATFDSHCGYRRIILRGLDVLSEVRTAHSDSLTSPHRRKITRRVVGWCRVRCLG